MYGHSSHTYMSHNSSAPVRPEKRHCASAIRPDMAPPSLVTSPSRRRPGTPVQADAADFDIARRDEQRHPAHPCVYLECHAGDYV